MQCLFSKCNICQALFSKLMIKDSLLRKIIRSFASLCGQKCLHLYRKKDTAYKIITK